MLKISLVAVDFVAFLDGGGKKKLIQPGRGEGRPHRKVIRPAPHCTNNANANSA